MKLLEPCPACDWMISKQATSCIRCGHPLRVPLSSPPPQWQCQRANCEKAGVHSCRDCGKLVCGKHALFADFRFRCQSCYPISKQIREEREICVGILVLLVILAAEVGAYPFFVNWMTSQLLSYSHALTSTVALSIAVSVAIFLGGLFVASILYELLRLLVISPMISDRHDE